MRVRRAATSANSAATKNAFASTSASTASRRRPDRFRGGPGIEAGNIERVARGGTAGILGNGGEEEGLVSATVPLEVQAHIELRCAEESRAAE